MLIGNCHCGAVGWQFDGLPTHATSCNCTVCRRHGTLTAYGFEDQGITVSGPTTSYVCGDRTLAFHFCPTCGCLAYWRALDPDAQGRRRVGVNLRLADPDLVAAVPVKRFDGLDSWEHLPSDGRKVADHWF